MLAVLLFSAIAVAGDCGAPPSQDAVAAYDKCKDQVMGAGGDGKTFLVDADSQVAWLVDRDGTTEDAECISPVFIAKKSQGDPATFGNQEGYTPFGLMMTYNHHSKRKRIGSNCLGLAGYSTANDRSDDSDRGVLIHESAGPTEGCLGVPKGTMKPLKEKLGVNSPVFVYGKNMDPSAACDNKGRTKRNSTPSVPRSSQ